MTVYQFQAHARAAKDLQFLTICLEGAANCRDEEQFGIIREAISVFTAPYNASNITSVCEEAEELFEMGVLNIGPYNAICRLVAELF